MAYRFKLSRSLARDFRDIARDEIETVRRCLQAVEPARGTPHLAVVTGGQATDGRTPEMAVDGSGVIAAIHTARKSLKRLRALLRLVESALPRKVFACEDRRYRDLARTLSGARDLQVKLDTLDHLERAAESDAMRRSIETVRQHLLERRPAISANTAPAALRRLVRALDEGERRLSSLVLGRRNRAVIVAGMGSAYRAGRKSFNLALRTRADEAFHDWRKDVQSHWRHMQLLTRAWPEEMAARAALAEALSEALGQDHDLWVLQNFYRAEIEPSEVQGDDIFIRSCRRRQADCRALAEGLGRQLYAEGTRAFEKRLSIYWREACRRRRLSKRLARPEGPEALDPASESEPARAKDRESLNETPARRTI